MFALFVWPTVYLLETVTVTTFYASSYDQAVNFRADTDEYEIQWRWSPDLVIRFRVTHTPQDQEFELARQCTSRQISERCVICNHNNWSVPIKEHLFQSTMKHVHSGWVWWFLKYMRKSEFIYKLQYWILFNGWTGAEHHSDITWAPWRLESLPTTLFLELFFFSGAHQSKHQSSALLALFIGIQWSPVGSPHKGSIIQKPHEYSFECVTKHSPAISMWVLLLL